MITYELHPRHPGERDSIPKVSFYDGVSGDADVFGFGAFCFWLVEVIGCEDGEIHLCHHPPCWFVASTTGDRQEC